jgi:hypothetical protein
MSGYCVTVTVVVPGKDSELISGSLSLQYRIRVRQWSDEHHGGHAGLSDQIRWM